jgi:hypothetical protein
VANGLGRTKVLFFAIAIYSVLTFLWRFFVPATEQNDPNFFIWMQFAWELLAPLGLISFFITLRRAAPDQEVLLGATLAIALIACIGIIGMRIGSEDGWYSGHRQYWPGGNPSWNAPPSQPAFA